MIRPTSDDHRVLAQVRRGPSGAAFLAFLARMLDEADIATRTATGEKIGWLQGEAQCLASLIKHFSDAETVGANKQA